MNQKEPRGRVPGAGAVAAVILFALGSGSIAGPREDRAVCWENYRVCADGAGRAEEWRTVCYSDYSACMKDPGELQCTEADEVSCKAVRAECLNDGDGSEVISYHCRQDFQVCLDSFGC